MKIFATASLTITLLHSFLLLCPFCLAQELSFNGDDNFVHPKGEYKRAPLMQHDYFTQESIYSYDTPTLVTGPYSNNANFLAATEYVHIPNVENNERLVVSFKCTMETESYYDICSAGYVLPDGRSYTLWSASGVIKEPEDIYIDITHLAGKSLKLFFSLQSDSTNNGGGWSVWDVKIERAGKLNPILKLAPADNSYKVNVLKVNTENFPDAVFVEFTVTDNAGNYIRDLKLSDFKLWDNDTEMTGCRRLVQDFSEVLLPIDVVFLVDNSWSMSGPQEKVNKAISTFVDSLKNKGNVRVGLVRFGQSEQKMLCPEYGVMEKTNGSFFIDLQTEADMANFRELWSRNKITGKYEPYYEVLNWITDQNVDYRANAQKVFIMIGDEDLIRCSNNITCDDQPSLLTQAGVAEKLNRQGIQTFIIEGASYYDQFSSIADGTGGGLYSVYTDDYCPILTDMGKKISGRYIMRYCLDIDNPEQIKGGERSVDVECNGDKDSRGSGKYYVTRLSKIVRSPATRALDTTAVDKGTPIPLEFDVIGNGNTIDYARVYIKRYTDDGSQPYSTLTLNASDAVSVKGDTLHFKIDVPGHWVDGPYMLYYIEASVHRNNGDGTTYKGTVSSPPYYRNDFAWYIAVNPRKAPEIANVSITPAFPCSTIEMQVEMKMEVEQYEVGVHYRIADTPSEYHEILATRQGNTGKYSVQIPATALSYNAVEYFVTAKSFDGLTGRYGSAENPMRIDIDPSAVVPKNYPMDIVFPSSSSVLVNCQGLADGDTIAAYYTAECGGVQTEYRMSTGVWSNATGSLRLRVYGDVEVKGYKNCYIDGDSIILRAIKNGKDYELTGHSLRYSHTAGTVVFEGAAVGVRIPIMKVEADGKEIRPEETIDFGECYTEQVKEVKIINVGCDTLLLKSATIDGDGSFILKSAVSNVDIAPGESYSINVAFIPQRSSNGALVLRTNTDEQTRVVRLKGVSKAKDSCFGMRVIKEPYSGGVSAFELTVEEPNLIAVMLIDGCNSEPIWFNMLELNPGVNRVEIGIDYHKGQYKIQTSTANMQLCEYPFTVKK